MENYTLSLFQRASERNPNWVMIHFVEDESLLNMRQKQLIKQHRATPVHMRRDNIIPDNMLWVDVNKQPDFTEGDLRYFMYLKEPEATWFKDLGLTACDDQKSPYYKHDIYLQKQTNICLATFVEMYRAKKFYQVVKRVANKRFVDIDYFNTPASINLHARVLTLFNDFASVQSKVDDYNKEVRRCKAKIATAALAFNDDYTDEEKKFSKKSILPDVIGEDLKVHFEGVKDVRDPESFRHIKTILEDQENIYLTHPDLFSIFPAFHDPKRIGGMKKEVAEVIGLHKTQISIKEKHKDIDSQFVAKVTESDGVPLIRLTMIELALIEWIRKQNKPCYCGACNGSGHHVVVEEKKTPPKRTEMPEEEEKELESEKQSEPIKEPELFAKFKEREAKKMKAPDYNELMRVVMVSPSRKSVYLALKNSYSYTFYTYEDGKVVERKEDDFMKPDDYPIYEFHVNFKDPYLIYDMEILRYAVSEEMGGVYVGEIYHEIKPDNLLKKFGNDESKTSLKLELPIGESKITLLGDDLKTNYEKLREEMDGRYKDKELPNYILLPEDAVIDYKLTLLKQDIKQEKLLRFNKPEEVRVETGKRVIEEVNDRERKKKHRRQFSQV